MKSDFWGADLSLAFYQVNCGWWGADITARSPLFSSPGVTEYTGTLHITGYTGTEHPGTYLGFGQGAEVSRGPW